MLNLVCGGVGGVLGRRPTVFIGVAMASVPQKVKNHGSGRHAIRLANHLHPKHDLN